MDGRTLRRNPKIDEAPLQGELKLFNPATSQFTVLIRTDGPHDETAAPAPERA